MNQSLFELNFLNSSCERCDSIVYLGEFCLFVSLLVRYVIYYLDTVTLAGEALREIIYRHYLDLKGNQYFITL